MVDAWHLFPPRKKLFRVIRPGLAAVVALRQLADRLEAGQVERAIDEGWSFAEIAAALGVSRQ
ncbi:MAG: helix-turn-helix domain-containing protein, partial [Actinomycetota bacterium]|nr:helix-turn-helix domain-containing protein [Actinomycetota bacterium]